MKILILCSDNCCLSQMVEGWLQYIDKTLKVYSASYNPGDEINPIAIKVLKNSGVDISNNKPKDVKNFTNERWDYVITVSADANENFPDFKGKLYNRKHIGFFDPSKAKGTPEYIESEFRRISNQIKTKMYDFYIDEIKNNEGPRCTCGRNRTCQCP